MYNSEKVIKDNFLNFLWALSCVILSADCHAIVFLHANFNVAFCLISNVKHRVHELVTRFFRCTITKKVEEHCSRSLTLLTSLNFLLAKNAKSLLSAIGTACDRPIPQTSSELMWQTWKNFLQKFVIFLAAILITDKRKKM